MRLAMSDEEILCLYREAKNPEREITLLAELNDVSPALIRLKLFELGASQRPPPEPVSKQRSRGCVDCEESLHLYHLGLADGEIAARLGVSPSGVANWRHRHELPANRPRGWPKGRTRKRR